MASIFATCETFTVTKDYLDFLNVLHTKIKKERFTESSKNVLLWPRCEIPLLESLRVCGLWRRMKRLTAFVRLILKLPDAGAVCTGNDRREGPVGTAIVSRLSDSYSLECGGTPHCTMGSLITQLIDNAAQIPLDSKLKQALQRAQKE